ncbi:MAG: hypothetical protein ABI634_00855 [Acidobacteriota bacterium]
MMDGALTCVGISGATERSLLADWLSPALREQVREDAYAFIKRLRHVTVDGMPMRARFTFRDDSLWWFTEIYLHKMRRIETAIATLLALDAACRHHDPARLSVTTTDATVGVAARAFAAAARQPIDIVASPTARSRPRWTSFLIGATAQASRLRPQRHVTVPAHTRVAAFVHTAFWRRRSAPDLIGEEHYIGPVLHALAAKTAAGVTCVGVGPRRTFRARRWWDTLTPGEPTVLPIEHLAPRHAIRDALAFWRRREQYAREVVAGDAVRAAGLYGQWDLWPILRAELEETARVQWPWSVRAMDEAGAALDTLKPGVVVTYAEAGGGGRALMLEARRRHIPSVGLQHGFIYRHWLNYRHERDEMSASGSDCGFPRPDLTLLFDGYAAAHLRSAGAFPPESLAITGSPRLDELAERVSSAVPDRAQMRTEAAVGPEGKLIVFAAKFTEIGDQLGAFFDAALSCPDVVVVVKPHPADRAEDYARVAAGRAGIRVAAPDADLGRLLAAADAVATMNSTVALDAMVLGVPAVVIGLPNNLTPFVEAGVMFGADRTSLGAVLRALLYDRRARDDWRQRARDYAARYDMRADGQAAARAADAILRVSR